jgi:DNA topoisomerase-1
MGKTLVVVESPAKAKTIKKYLGAGYEVVASKGHIKDLPKRMGIDVEKGFQETYEVIESKAKVLADLKLEAKKVDTLLLATDPDSRRGGDRVAPGRGAEAPRADGEARRVRRDHEERRRPRIESPRELDQDLYDAQRARRVLDRIVGYDVSALVWNKLAFGLSAGRVSPCACVSSSTASVRSKRSCPREVLERRRRSESQAGPLAARLAKADGEKLEVTNGEQAAAVRRDLESAKFKVACRHAARAEAQRAGPVHDEQAPAGRHELPAFHHQAHDERRASACTRVSTSRRTAVSSASSPTCVPTPCA